MPNRTAPAGPVARDYVEAVHARARAPLEPPGFTPNWADQPYRYKRYAGAERTLLPLCPPIDEPGDPAGRADVAEMLRLSYAPLSRRVDVTCNDDVLDRTRYAGAVWGRGAASGGGLYPLEIYWVCGADGPLPAGVYHYAPAHHALERLAVGDLTRQVREATMGDRVAAESSQFLVISARLWRNAFKYHNFSYYVVSQDVGALLGTWQAIDPRLRPVLWFADEKVNRLLGLDTENESAFAVVPLPFGARAVAPAVPDAPADAPAVAARAIERSRVVRRFPRTDAVHRAALVTTQPRPAPGVRAAAPEPPGGLALPADRLPDLGTPAVLLMRRSSFGRFAARPTLPAGHLGTLLAAMAHARGRPSDLDPAGGSGLTRFMVVANHVAGVAAGCYSYDSAGSRLSTVADTAPSGPYLQRSYQLVNYDMGQVAAIVAIVGRPAAALDHFGERGLRVLNAEAGAVAQTGYLAAAVLGIGCGAVLGLDNLAMNDLLKLTDTDERTLLFLLVGRDRGGFAALDLSLLTGPQGRPA